MATNFSFPVDTGSVSWLDSSGGVHIRVYSSDGYKVTERCYDAGSGWTTGAFAQAGSNVSATSWESGGTVFIRVYCTYQDESTEWCWDGDGWYRGAYTLS